MAKIGTDFESNPVEADFEEYRSSQVPTGFLEGFDASALLGTTTSPIGRITDILEVNRAEDEAKGRVSVYKLNEDGTLVWPPQIIQPDPKQAEMLDPDSINLEFPEIANQASEPMTRAAAETLARQKRRNIEASGKVARQSGFSLNLVASFVPGATDPLPWIAFAATSGLIRAAAAPVGMLKALGFGLRPTARQAGTRLAVEGLAGGAAIEAGFGALSQQQLEEFDIVHSAKMVGMFALGFGGVRYGGGKLMGFMKNRRMLKQAAIEAELGSVGIGKSANLADDLIRDAALETNFSHSTGKQVAPFNGKNSLKAMDDLNLGDRSMYIGTHKPHPVLKKKSIGLIGEDLGDLVYLSDDANVAKGLAASKYNFPKGTVGNIFEVEMGKLKLLNAELPITKDIIKAIKASMPKGMKTRFNLNKNFLSVVDDIKAEIQAGNLPESQISKLNSEIKKAGFDGYRYVQTKTPLGDPHNPNNVVALFDSAGLKHKKTHKGRAGDTGGLSDRQAQGVKDKMNSAEANPFHSDELAAMERKRFEAIPKDKPVNIEMQKSLDEVVEDLAQQSKAGTLDSSAVKAVKSLQDDVAKMADERIAFKAFKDCET